MGSSNESNKKESQSYFQESQQTIINQSSGYSDSSGIKVLELRNPEITLDESNYGTFIEEKSETQQDYF